MKYFECTQENIKALIKRRDEKLAQSEYTGIKALDEIFGYLIPGSTYMICAGTGVGKSSFLLATAKKIALNKKVLYVTIEQNDEQLADVLPKNNSNLGFYEMEVWNEWKDIEILNQEKNYDYIIFDYLGADCVEEWDELINKSGELANMAKKNNWIIITACQAKPEIIEEFKNDQFSLKLFTPMYIAYSKGMAAKIAGGVYLIKQKDSIFYLYNFKNRYRPLNIMPYTLTNLNLEKKEFMED